MVTEQAIISGTDVKEILEANVPGLKIEQVSGCAVCRIIEGFANHTIDLIKKGNISGLKSCFNAAEQILAGGSNEVKHAMENVYVYSITIFFDMATAMSRQVKELLPLQLMNEYQKQVAGSHP
ncbi:MAG: hypothetical protein ACLQQ4_05025 [Bacteroidia bacterium]